MKTYRAPWSTALIVMSAMVTVLCVGIAAFAFWEATAKHHSGLVLLAALLPLTLLFGTAPFTIRGYTITPEAILVHRLLWETALPRAGMESARVEPEAMFWSLRTFGNGGVFSFTGFYYNKRLGSYRAYVTDPRRAVVLRFARRRIVVSPDSPEDFVRALGMREGYGVNTP
jgi:hypothetical protein